MAKKQQAPMAQAVAALFAIESGSGLATPAQILEVAERFELEVGAVECCYLDAVDALADA